MLAARQTQQTETPTVVFNNQPVNLLMPSGLVLLCPSLDQTFTLPSWKANASTDILEDSLPAYSPNYPTCELWPSNPPRARLYCEADMLAHPLVSPITVRSWAGSPPMWIAAGAGERLLDGAKLLAQTAAHQGVTVLFEEYEAMPHTWPIVFRTWPQTTFYIEHSASACTRFTSGGNRRLATEGKRIKLGTLETETLDVLHLTSLSVLDMKERMRDHIRSLKPFTGAVGGKASL